LAHPEQATEFEKHDQARRIYCPDNPQGQGQERPQQEEFLNLAFQHSFTVQNPYQFISLPVILLIKLK